jgi:hypothetical protein
MMHILAKIVTGERGWIGHVIWAFWYPERAAYEAAGAKSYSLEETFESSDLKEKPTTDSSAPRQP